MSARPLGVTVMLVTSDAMIAEATLPAEQWARVVRGWVNAQAYVPATGAPTLDACRAAGATYVVNAAITAVADPVRAKRFPGRTFADVETTVVNCVTGTQTARVTVPVMSDPSSSATDGDYESTSEVSWKSLGDQLARTHLPVSQLLRITRIDGPYVYIDAANGRDFPIGSQLRIYADDNAQRIPPVDLTIDDVVDNRIQALYDVTKPANVVKVGDYVEPIRPTK
jgi:hypothetical protein